MLGREGRPPTPAASCWCHRRGPTYLDLVLYTPPTASTSVRHPPLPPPKAYEARGMERRKSRQFDGTDDPELVAAAAAAASAATPATSARASGGGGAAPGLLRREVSKAYTAVATAGEAVSESSVDALAVLLRLMEAQVR